MMLHAKDDKVTSDFKKTVLITGASTGIGYGAAGAFAGKGYRVIATVRSQGDAERLAAEISGDIHPVICDVTNPRQVEQLAAAVENLAGGRLDCLINNAGIALSPGPVEHQRMEDIRAQFEVNVFGLMAVTIRLLPYLGTQPDQQPTPGRIMNISSVGGLLASPFLSAYASSKHAVEGFSHSLRRELRMFGIKVIIVGPGSIRTKIWEKNRGAAENPFGATRYGEAFAGFVKYSEVVENSGADPADIGAFLLSIAESPRPRVRYAYVRRSLMNWTLPFLLPHAWLDEVLAKTMNLRAGHSWQEGRR